MAVLSFTLYLDLCWYLCEQKYYIDTNTFASINF